MTINREPADAGARVSRQDIDQLFASAPTVGDLMKMDLDFFASDEELDEFLVWLRAQRAADLA